jgi:hypothetical protein
MSAGKPADISGFKHPSRKRLHNQCARCVDIDWHVGAFGHIMKAEGEFFATLFEHPRAFFLSGFKHREIKPNAKEKKMKKNYTTATSVPVRSLPSKRQSKSPYMYL